MSRNTAKRASRQNFQVQCGSSRARKFFSVLAEVPGRERVLSNVKTWKQILQFLGGKYSKMGKIEWAMWANEQAVASSVVVFLGGVLSWIGKFKKWQIAVYAVAAGILIFLLEYPRGKRQKGRTKERIAQKFLTPVIRSLGPFGRNYYFRFVLYLGLAIPCGFLLSTLLGGVCLFISSIIYLVAALAGEEWKPCVVSSEASQENTTNLPSAPSQPPPRLHQVTRSSENLYENSPNL